MERAARAPVIHPRPSIGRRLDRAARGSFPAGSTVLLMLAATAPWGLAKQAALLPAVTLGSVWFWSLRYPSALSPVLVFAVGVLWDLLGYTPLGAGVLTLLMVQGLAGRARRTLRSERLLLEWPAFGAVALGAALLGWSLISGLQWRAVPLPPALFQCALTVAVYPALRALLGGAHGSFAAPERA